MSLQRVTRLPPLRPSEKYRARQGNGNDPMTEESDVEVIAPAVKQATKAKMLPLAESNSVYSGTQRKPPFLVYLENYLDRELHALNPNEQKYKELKLQVYRDIFSFFIKEFKTYQPLLFAIKRAYENALACQEDQILEIEALRSHLRHVTEECNRKIQARWGEEQAEIGTLKKENEKLQDKIKAQTLKETNTQAVVDRLQSELSNLYLQYRDECDARKLLIWQLNDLTKCSFKDERSEKKYSGETMDPVELQLALKVCRQDLTKAQEELTRIKADYFDVVPRRDWDALEQEHNQTVRKLTTLQGDFDLMKIEFDALLEIYKKGSLQMETQHVTGQVETVLQTENQNHTSAQVHMQISANEAPNTSSSLKSDEAIDKLVTSAQGESDSTNDCIPLGKLYTVPEESGVGTLHAGFQESQYTDTSSSNYGFC